MLDLTVPVAFVVGALIGAGLVGGIIGWYLRDRH